MIIYEYYVCNDNVTRYRAIVLRHLGICCRRKNR